MKRKFMLATSLVTLLMLIGCTSTYQSRVYKSLTVSKTTYDTLLSAAGDLYNQGKIEDAEKDRIIEIGNAYKTTHNLAVATLLTFHESNSLEDEERYLNYVSDAASLLAELISLIQPYLIEEE